jgi:hypothetical protein
VNLEMSVAAIQLEERSDCPASPFASNEGVIKTPSKTHKAKVPMKYNKFCKQYSITDAWLNGNIAKYQRKLVGGDLLISSSCILISNVPHVLFHTHNN